MPSYGLGLVPSPVDPRDYPLSSVVDLGISLPVWYQAWKPGQGPAVLDQKSSPMCVAFSSAGEADWQEYRDEGKPHVFDAPWLYKECKKRDGFPGDGTYIRVAMKVRKDVGFKTKGRADAKEHRIESYYAIPLDEQSLKAAIFQTGPILIGSKWYQSWFKPLDAGRLPPPDKVVGGHATFIWGWDDKRRIFYGRNSWGQKWGVNGNYQLPYDYLDELHDAWKCLDRKDGGVSRFEKQDRE